MFYAVLALIATKDFGSSKHSGVISFFDREFVKPGLLPRELSKALHIAFERRQVHDYGELIAVDEITAEETIQDASTFVGAIESYLQEHGYPI